jgi:hypothetical protein
MRNTWRTALLFGSVVDVVGAGWVVGAAGGGLADFDEPDEEQPASNASAAKEAKTTGDLGTAVHLAESDQ